jgi:hypothetical protein
MVLTAAGMGEHESTTTVVVATGTAVGTVGGCPTITVKDDVAAAQVACRPGGTLVEHPQNHLQKVLT